MSSATSALGSGTPVTSYSTFCEGDIEPTLHKRIRILIDKQPNYIVYIDDDLFVEWALHLPAASDFDTVANEIGHLETLAITQLLPSQRELLARLLGEAMARILGDTRNKDGAQEVLSEAREYLNARGTENARKWYLIGSGTMCGGFLAIAGFLLFMRVKVASGAWQQFIEILASATLASLGAMISIASRTEKINVEPVAGQRIHAFEGAVRVIVGVIGASFVAISIKADILLGIFHSLSQPFLALIVACMVAGASERLIPSLITNMGKSFNMRTKS